MHDLRFRIRACGKGVRWCGNRLIADRWMLYPDYGSPMTNNLVLMLDLQGLLALAEPGDVRILTRKAIKR